MYSVYRTCDSHNHTLFNTLPYTCADHGAYMYIAVAVAAGLSDALCFSRSSHFGPDTLCTAEIRESRARSLPFRISFNYDDMATHVCGVHADSPRHWRHRIDWCRTCSCYELVVICSDA